jgi:hypothetical protein
MYTYPNDANSSTLFTTSSFSDMRNKKPDKGFSTQQNFSSIIFESEAGYEKRRLRSRRGTREYSLTYTNVDGLVKYAIDTFYRQRGGEYESFYFDLSHLNDTGNVVTRFSGPLSIVQNLSTGANALNNYYTVSFTLKETFD